MSKIGLWTALPIAGLLVMIGLVVMQAGKTPTPGELKAHLVGLSGDAEGGHDAALRKICVLGSIRPASHPDWPVVRESLAKAEADAFSLGDLPILVFMAPALAFCVSLIGLATLFISFRKLKRGDEGVSSDLLDRRRHCVTATMGLVLSGLIASVGGGCALLISMPSLAGGGELHGVIQVFLLPVGVWVGSLMVFLRKRNGRMRGANIAVSAGICALLAALLASVVGAINLKLAVAAFVLWVALTIVVDEFVLDRVDYVAATM
jgi:hypothetical protein